MTVNTPELIIAFQSEDEMLDFLESLPRHQLNKLSNEQMSITEVNALIIAYRQQKQDTINFWKLPCLNQT